MERSTIHFLKQKGWTNVQITEFTGHHRDTIARVLQEAVEKKPKTRQRSSAVDVFRPQIATWLDQNLPVIRMLELAREDHDHSYSGSETAFYDYVRKMRRARNQTPRDVALRFEGVPGEYLQIDWGEERGSVIPCFDNVVAGSCNRDFRLPVGLQPRWCVVFFWIGSIDVRAERAGRGSGGGRSVRGTIRLGAEAPHLES